MKTLLSLVLSGVAIIALSGCGSSGGSDVTGDTSGTGGGTTNPTTPDEIKTSIVGTWKTACYEETPTEFYIEEMIFEADGSGHYYEKEYDVAGCNPQNVVDSEDIVFDYTVGITVKASDGKDAVEFNFDAVAANIPDYYTMVRFDASKLLMADDDDGGPHSGDSSNERANDFTESVPMVKQ